MYQAIDANKQKSAFLMAFFVGLLLAAGYLYGYVTETGWFGLGIAVVVSLVSTLVTWFAGDAIVLSTSGAERIETREQAPELWNLVENLSITAGVPMPKVYIINDGSPNAFATGRAPEHASVAVTTGLLARLNRTELEGVLAHELSHVKNYDIRWMMVVAILVGSLSLLSELFFRSGGLFGRKRDDKGGGGGGWLAIVGLVLLILAPIVGQLIKLAISRKREFLADASGALLTRYPEGLASALEKISQAGIPVAKAPSATAHLWISSPLHREGKANFLEKLFSTHPPVEERIAQLRSMGR